MSLSINTVEKVLPITSEQVRKYSEEFFSKFPVLKEQFAFLSSNSEIVMCTLWLTKISLQRHLFNLSVNDVDREMTNFSLLMYMSSQHISDLNELRKKLITSDMGLMETVVVHVNILIDLWQKENHKP